MKYSDGNDAMIGDVVQIAGQYQGVVVACMDTGSFMQGYEHCDYLNVGIMVDTSFGGLVHYTPEATDEMVLISRNDSP